MRKWNHLVLFTSVVAAVLLLPVLKAHANHGSPTTDPRTLEPSDYPLWGYESAHVQIGMIGNEAWMGVWHPNVNFGNCRWWKLGDAQGLSNNVIVRPWHEHANGSFAMAVTTGTNSWCGFTWTPLLRNGHWVRFEGWIFTDVLASADSMYGQAGNDLLIGSPNVLHHVNGGAGNDKLNVGPGSTAYGGNGADTICGYSNVAPRIVTGNGNLGSDGFVDTYCGLLPSEWFNDIQVFNQNCTCS